MPPYGGADEEDYSSSDDDGSSYASTDEEFEAPPPPPPEDPPASDAIVEAAPRDMVVHDNEDDDDEEAAGSDEEQGAMASREPVETPTKQPSPYNSDSAAAVAASTLASKPQSLYHHTQNYQDPDEVAEELEITSSPTLKRLNKEEKAARRKQWCHEKRYVILGAVLLVLVAIAVALGVVLGGSGSNSKSGGGSVNIPDDFPSQPDDFAGPSISTAGDATDTSSGTAPSPTAPTNDENISGPSPAPTDPRDPSLAALTDYLKSLETTTADGDSALSDPNTPQAQARDYVLTTLTQNDVDVLAALVKTGTEGNPNEGVQLRVGQLYGLATAFLSTDGDRWANRDGWMGNVGSSANDPCGWSGVTCVGDVQTVTDLPGADMNAGGRRKLSTTSIASDRKTHIDDIQRRARSINGNANADTNAGNGRKLQQNIPPEAIIEIDLSENGLNGQLPSDFGTLFPYLRTLSMPSNNLRGPLPESLFNGQTPDLQIVDLYDNNFSGSISSNVGNMNNLLVLGLGDNDIEGQIPASLPSSLQFLELGGNDMFGNIPGDAIGAMADLENFAVSDNERLVGSIPGSMFDNKSKLLRLELDDCNFDGSIPPQIGQAQALNYINMNGNALLSGEIPEELYSLADLDTLLLYETAVSGSISPSIGQLTNLSVLFLNDNNLSGPIPAEISNCKSLVELKLDDNNFTGGIPAEITALPLLERLHIHNNPELRGEIPESIGDLVALRELFLYSCGISGAVPDSIGELSNLVTLAINNNELSEITDKVEGLTSLQVLGEWSVYMYCTKGDFFGPLGILLKRPEKSSLLMSFYQI